MLALVDRGSCWVSVRHNRAPALVTIAFAAFATRTFQLISKYSVNIFFSDQWEFNDATLFRKHSLWQVFRWQHGWHRQGVGGLFEKLIDPLIHWDSRKEAFIAGAMLVVTCALVLWLKYRLFGSLTVWDIAIPAIVLTPGQWMSLFGVLNFAQGIFPMLLIVLSCLAWTIKRNGLRYPLVLLINFLAIYTGFGLFVGVMTPALLVLDRLRNSDSRLPAKYFGGALMISLASLASFFVDYAPQHDCPAFLASIAPEFVGVMFVRVFAIRDSIAATIGTALIPLIMLIVLGLSIHRKRLVIALMLSVTLLVCCGAAYGRSCFGLSGALANRYVLYTEPGLLGLYFFMLHMRNGLTKALLLSALILALTIAATRVDVDQIAEFSTEKRLWKDCYLKTEDITKCESQTSRDVFTPHGAEAMDGRMKLEFLKLHRLNLYAE